jgi:hypothetical protein
LLLLAAVTLPPAVAQATILADWSLEERARRADRIVVGVVGDARGVRAGGRVLTEIDIRVEQTLAGVHVDTFILSQLGGRWGDTIVEVIGTARLTRGARVLLFVERARDGRDYLVAMSLGAYVVDDDGRAHQRLDVPLAGPDGTVRPPPGAQSIDFGRIEEIIRATRPGVEP